MSHDARYVRFTSKRALSLCLRWNACLWPTRQRFFQHAFATAMDLEWRHNQGFAYDAVVAWITARQLHAHVEDAWHAAMERVREAMRMGLRALARHELTVAQYWRKRVEQRGDGLRLV